VASWPSTRAGRVIAALLRIGWRIKRERGSHKTFARDGWADYVFASTIARRSVPRCSLASR